MHSCLPSHFFLFVNLPPGKQMCGTAFHLSTEKRHPSPSHSPSIIVIFHIKGKLLKLSHKWLSLLCLRFSITHWVRVVQILCDAGSGDNFSVSISFLSHHHPFQFSSIMKSPSPASVHHTLRWLSFNPFAIYFSAWSLEFGTSLHVAKTLCSPYFYVIFKGSHMVL